RFLPARVSKAAPYTDEPGKNGPAIVHRRRAGREPKRKSPFIVPTSRSASPSRTEREEATGVLSFLAGMEGVYGKPDLRFPQGRASSPRPLRPAGAALRRSRR